MNADSSTEPADAVKAVYAKFKAVAKSPEIAGDLKRLTAAIELTCLAPEEEAEKIISIIAEMIPRPVLDVPEIDAYSAAAEGNIVDFSAAKTRIRTANFHHQGELEQ